MWGQHPGQAVRSGWVGAARTDPGGKSQSCALHTLGHPQAASQCPLASAKESLAYTSLRVMRWP